MRAKSKRTTLTFNPLPPKEGEEVIWSGSEHPYREKDFRIRVSAGAKSSNDPAIPREKIGTLPHPLLRWVWEGVQLVLEVKG